MHVKPKKLYTITLLYGINISGAKSVSMDIINISIAVIAKFPLSLLYAYSIIINANTKKPIDQTLYRKVPCVLDKKLEIIINVIISIIIDIPIEQFATALFNMFFSTSFDNFLSVFILSISFKIFFFTYIPFLSLVLI